jgi:3-deoxy-manno-octulosonate cytidylyltransferase (CMP-KDO synthetase)
MQIIEMKFIGIIPARFQSTRFPGKPLALIHGKPMIQWVVERSSRALESVWVATDHERIAAVVQEFGGNVVMTAASHSSGTDRCAEAARILEEKTSFDAIINIQGDEPFILPEQIQELKDAFSPDVQIATLIKKITDLTELHDPNRPKVVLNTQREAIYFSRSVIPYCRGTEQDEWLHAAEYWSHIGIYGYRKDVLQKITNLPSGKLEKAESLEQLRWLENGFRIQCGITEFVSFGIDTPEDLVKAEKHFSELFV